VVPRVFHDGEALFTTGGISDEMHFVVEGTVNVFLVTPLEERLPLAVVRRGETIGEMGVIDDAPRSASAVANGEVRTLALSQTRYRELAARGDPVAVWLLDTTARGIARRIEAMTERVARARIDPQVLRNLPKDPREQVKRWWHWLGVGRMGG
jgi:CRP-like cAMP-binding protein